MVNTRRLYSIDWRFLAVGRTKFNPYRLFFNIQTMLKQQTVLTGPELNQHIDKIENKTAVSYNSAGIRYWYGPI